MADKTKIDWCDMSWNPVTGCLHNCPYCYARRVATRFGGASETHCNECVGTECQWVTEATGEAHVLSEPAFDPDRGHKAPFPYGFDPTFHRYRLDEPARKTRPRNIFVCSMADLFGKWVPTKWIVEVLDACRAAPQHNYMFLTKNPARYGELDKLALLPMAANFWYGTTVTSPFTPYFASEYHKTFLSIEPLLAPLGESEAAARSVDWVIVGAETGNRKGKVKPEREWVVDIVQSCQLANVPVFMKNNLSDVWGAPLLQEYPEGLRHD